MGKKTTSINWYNDSKMRYFYKFRVLFCGEQDFKMASFTAKHSLLASIILDYEKTPDENKIITNLRENYNKILEFSKDDSKQFITIKNIDIAYQSEYKEMLKHILISDKNFPKNIDKSSIRKISDDLTYIICKNNVKGGFAIWIMLK